MPAKRLPAIASDLDRLSAARRQADLLYQVLVRLSDRRRLLSRYGAGRWRHTYTIPNLGLTSELVEG